MYTLICLLLLIKPSLSNPILEERNEVVEVDRGETVVLLCRSNDPDHNFLFWQLEKPVHAVIGPGSVYDKHKYEYEVLSGKLTIKGVSVDEEGFYNCVSRGVRNDNINVRTARMIVKREWEEAEIHDSSANFFSYSVRVIALVGSFVVLLMGSYLLYLKKMDEAVIPPYFRNLEDEDSAEEMFIAADSSTSRNEPDTVLTEGHDNQALETTFSLVKTDNEK